MALHRKSFSNGESVEEYQASILILDTCYQ